MKIARGRNLTIREWAILFGTLAASIGVPAALGLGPKWEHSFVYTVIVFVTVVVVLRLAWGRPAFWRGLAVVFSFHVFAVVFVTRALPDGSRGIHGVPLIVASMAEAMLIASVLWKASSRWSSRPPR